MQALRIAMLLHQSIAQSPDSSGQQHALQALQALLQLQPGNSVEVMLLQTAFAAICAVLSTACKSKVLTGVEYAQQYLAVLLALIAHSSAVPVCKAR